MKHAAGMIDWDGTPLDNESLVELEIEWEEKPTAKTAGAPLEEAIHRASRGDGGRRGVVIEGAPGSGKSVLSHRLETRLGQPPFDELGFAVRRGARELAVALEKNPEAPLGPLPSEGPEVVAIIDGIDELTSQQARAVVTWLERTPGWWIATTRPFANMRARLPPAWKLRIAPLSSQDARRILDARGRGDLAAALFEFTPEREARVRVLLELTRTPLLLVLLARVLAQGAPLQELRIHDVYARLFDGMLEQALQMGRLREGAAARLGRLREAVVGELALEWLRAPSGSLDRTIVNSVLDHAGFRGAELAELAEALEFGHLLVPVGDGFDFAHRTIAEWAGAMALRRRVADRLRHCERESGRSLERHERANIEGEQLDPFLQERPLERGRWEQLLRFYASFVVEPLALLESLVGARARRSWPPRTWEALREWEIAGALMVGASWTRPVDARAVWGIAVRYWLLRLPQRHHGDTGLEVVVDLAAAVAQHLPESLDELIAIAAQTDAQREALLADPLILLPALPATRAEALTKYLRGGDRETQLSILEWHEARGAPVASDVIETLIRELPAEVDSIVPDPDMDGIPQRLRDLRRLEQLTWDAAVRAHVSLRGPAARKRMQAHPAHLSGAIENWFGQPAIQRNAWDTSDAKDDQARRQLLAFELGDGAEYGARYRAERLLRALHSSRLDAVAGELFNSLRPDDPARDALVALMDGTGSVPTAAAVAVQGHRVAVAASTPAEPAHELPRWRPEPMPVDPIVIRFDGIDLDLHAIVELALEIIGGDVHEVYGTPGPLGAEYDEPPDLDWHSTDRNADVVRAVVGAVDRALQRDPGSWCDLRRLLAHPSQSLRLAAFERCAARCEPYDVIPLALEALEQHVRHDDTRLSGRWQGFLMAAHSGGGSGTIHVDVPDVRAKLVRAVRKRLTSAHRRLIESLALHEVPLLRVLAAMWSRDLGDATWAEILEPLLSDVHAKVVRAALDGLETLAPEDVDAYVLRAERSRWTVAHDAEIFELQRAWSPTALIPLVDEAAARCAAVERSGVFNGCPSPVEEALQRAAWTESDAVALASHVRQWAAHPEPRVRFAGARVGVSRGILPITPLVPLLESNDVEERVSALECITRSGETSDVGRVLEIWGTLFTKTWPRHGLHIGGPELEGRILWALDGAPVEFAPLLAYVANYIPFDHAEMVYEKRGEEIVARVASIVTRWGDPGVARLLELLDDEQVEYHHDFGQLIAARARRDPDFRAHLEARATAEKPASGRIFKETASSRILEDIRRAERERDLDGLLETLRRDVFPRDWSALTARTPPEPAPPRPPTEKHTILFLAANPSGTDQRALDREARAIQAELERSGFRDRFELVTRWAVEPLDLLRELRKLKPTVVHFSGHGGQDRPGAQLLGQSSHRDVGADRSVEEPPHGLLFHGPGDCAQLVSTLVLEETFRAAGASVRLVVLSACYSEAQAEALLAHVACVVGMGGSIQDDAARSFAIGFYGGLGERESVAAAYKQGCVAIRLEGLHDADRPQLKVRAGVDAGQLVLAADPS